MKNSLFKSLSNYLKLVKFSHTLFAMPFALAGFFWGVHYSNNFTWILLLKVILCMVFARNAAMSFNRIVDIRIDTLNYRTNQRELPAQHIKIKQAIIFCFINALAFIACAFWINFLCFILSPVALIVVLGYSYTKRFTWFCHLILGLGLSLAPIGAFIATTNQINTPIILLGMSVLLWVSGFDIIYALQDINFDKANNLKSIPERIGIKKSLIISSILHVISLILLLFSGFYQQVGLLYWLGCICFSALLFYQHIIISEKDLSRVNQAFFTFNGFASIIFSIFCIADSYFPIIF